MTAAFGPNVAHIVDALYPPARQALADALAADSRRIFALSVVVEIVVLWLYFRTGYAIKVRVWLERRLRVGIARLFVVAFAFTLVSVVAYSLLTLPIAYYASFTLPHAFGLSRESPQQWLRDWAVAFALTALVGAILAALFVETADRWPRRWPVIAAVAAMPLILFGFAIYPVYVAPLFNKYTPLAPSPLTRSILRLAGRQRINADVVYVYDMSRQSLEANAYIAGIGSTERIAVSDNLMRNFKPDEIEYVVAHEMGHYKLHHLWIGALTTWIDVVIALAVVYLLGNRFMKAGRATGFGDPAALPLMALGLLCYELATMPASNAVSRRVEHAADAFAAAHASAGDAGVRAFARLANQDLAPLHPAPLVVWYFYTHPPMDERIAFAARAPRVTTDP